MIDSTYIEIATTVVGATVAFLVSHRVVSRKSIESKLMWASAAVQAAEELYPQLEGAAKARYAADQLLAKFGLDEDEAVMLVHAAVTGLRGNGVKGSA